jgi:hypothetical protein
MGGASCRRGKLTRLFNDRIGDGTEGRANVQDMGLRCPLH